MTNEEEVEALLKSETQDGAASFLSLESRRIFRQLAQDWLRLQEENQRLRAAVLNQSGDDLCWLTGGEVSILPEGEFLESCRRFHGQLKGARPVLASSMTIAQLEAEVERLREEVRVLSTRPPKDQRAMDLIRETARMIEDGQIKAGL